jgi:hypothetical protein
MCPQGSRAAVSHAAPDHNESVCWRGPPPRRQLLQDATTFPFRPSAPPAVKTAFEQMHRRVCRTIDRSQVDAARCSTSRASDFQRREADLK